MSATTPRRNWLLMAIVAVLAFGAVMFIAGRATAPTESAVETGSDNDNSAVTQPDATVKGSDAASNATPANGSGDDIADDDSTGVDITSNDATGNDATSENTVALPPGCEWPEDFPTVALSALPAEAYDTIGVIADGPPYPYRADGGVFQNREGILPDRERGYYLEFTVETPGSSDRGARRIVTGDCGEFFYTADHYDSFELIDLER